MGDRVNDEGFYFETLRKLSAETSIDIKAVRRAVSQLIETGLIVDTGERCGRSNQVKVYRLMSTTTEQEGDYKVDSVATASQ